MTILEYQNDKLSQGTIYFSDFILTGEACLEIGLNSVNIKDCELQWRMFRGVGFESRSRGGRNSLAV